MSAVQHKLSIENVHKAYQQKAAVRAVSMDVFSGEIVGLLGANGAGKTTIFSILMGLIKPDQGKILINDKDISFFPMHLRAREGIAYLPQESSIFRKLSVVDNLRVSLEMRPDLDEQGTQTALEALLHQFHLNDVRDHLGWALSGGQRRRVEIARTLACNPLFVLLDEPFANIDPISIQEVQELMLCLCKERIGLVLTDHNVQAALRICDRAYIIDHGSIIASGSGADIVRDKKVQSAYLGDQFTI